MAARDVTNPNAPVTQGQCSANVRMVLQQGEAQAEVLKSITGKLDAQVVEQKLQATALQDVKSVLGAAIGGVQTALAEHLGEHKGKASGKASAQADQAEKRSSQQLSLRTVGLLLTGASLLVAAVVWILMRTAQPATVTSKDDELLAAVRDLRGAVVALQKDKGGTP